MSLPSLAFPLLTAIVSGVLVWWVRGMPERKRAAIDENKAIFAEWHALKTTIEDELRKCHGEREVYLKQVTRLSEENFRLRLVVTLILEELGKLDPDSDAAAKARVIMATPTSVPDAPTEQRPLEELLQEMDIRTAGVAPKGAARRGRASKRQ